MARKLGQDFLDAHVVHYKTGTSGAGSSQPDEPGPAPALGPRKADSCEDTTPNQSS